MIIDAISNGIVIDHITAGKAMQVYNMLNLDKLDCQVAIIRNAASTRTGTKDIIKIASYKDLDLGVLSFVCPTATINVIRDGRVLEKRNVDLPEKIVDILKCKNPRCITTTEQEIHHVFVLTDAEKGEYRCMYCDTKASN